MCDCKLKSWLASLIAVKKDKGWLNSLVVVVRKGRGVRECLAAFYIFKLLRVLFDTSTIHNFVNFDVSIVSYRVLKIRLFNVEHLQLCGRGAE